MGITKFKSFQEAERALWTYFPDEDYYKRIRALFELKEKLSPTKPQPGIRKYKSLDDRMK